jgi:6-pyruvoyltetrahydropterin/6-carboxytetrahydropterin synthase
MYTISKEFKFAASHSLENLPENHPCSRVHGHNYTVMVELRSNALNEAGFVLDYRALEPIKKWIDEVLDHRHLNDIVEFNPSAENLANYLHHNCQKLLPDLYKKGIWISAITVSETDKTWARYEP